MEYKIDITSITTNTSSVVPFVTTSDICPTVKTVNRNTTSKELDGMFSSQAIMFSVVLGNHSGITSTSVIVIFVALIISNNQCE